MLLRKRKLNWNQAIGKRRFVCENAAGMYGIKTHNFEETLGKYGRYIDREELGRFSRVLITARKEDGV